MITPTLAHSNGEMIVHIPLTFIKRQGRKQVVLPTSTSAMPPANTRLDDPVALAVARGFCWQDLLDRGDYPTVRALAQALGLDTALVARTIRLTLLAPDIIDAIMAGQYLPGISLKRLSKAFPLDWEDQRREFGVAPHTHAHEKEQKR